MFVLEDASWLLSETSIKPIDSWRNETISKFQNKHFIIDLLSILDEMHASHLLVHLE